MGSSSCRLFVGFTVVALFSSTPTMFGCAAERAMSKLRLASMQTWGHPQAVIRSDFPDRELPLTELHELEPSSPGSGILRDAVVARADVREFVQEHGVPDGVAITRDGLQLELLYASDSTAYRFDLGFLMSAQVVATRNLTCAEETAIKPESFWRRKANDLRVYLDDTMRVLSITRRLLREVPAEGEVARDVGFMVVDATPASALLFDLRDDTRGVIVAYIDPDGAAAGLLRRGEVIASLNGRAVGGAAAYDLDVLEDAGPVRVARQRAGDSATVEVVPREVPFGMDIFVVDTWEVNAFAFPGFLAFTTGMLNFCDEDELAFIVGHELGHLAQLQDGSRKVRTALRKGGMAPGVIAAPDLDDLRQRSFDFWGSYPYRDARPPQERELLADSYGIEYAARAGYDPSAALRLLEKLGARESAERVAWFVKTHPPAAERVEQARGIIGALKAAKATVR